MSELSTEKGRKRGRLKDLVASNAPEIAKTLGGPLAGAAVEALARAIFGDAAVDSGDVSEEVLADALQRATPEQLLALKKADQAFQLAVRHAAIDDARVAAADRANARARQAAMGDRTPAILGSIIISGFFLVLAIMVARKLPAGAETEFAIMLGALATMTAAVVNYYFGSSVGSREKTRMLTPSAPTVDQRP